MKKEKLFEHEGNWVSKYILSNNSGMTVEFLDLGCVIYSLKVPDRNGNQLDVVLGYEDPKSYVENPVFFGAAIGRFSNRIAKGQFKWNGEIIQLETNDGNNHLHGGSKGFWNKIWKLMEAEHEASENSLTFHLNSPDGDSDYPGEVDCYVTYTLTDDNELIIEYRATTPTESIVNLTNHSYFNLNGDGSASVLNHYLKINSDQFTEITPEAIPTGKLLSVENTPLDFRSSKQIGLDIEADYEQLRLTGGYDHNYVFRQGHADVTADSAVDATVDSTDSTIGSPISAEADVTAYSPETGIQLEMFTNSPGMQLYTGNAIAENMIGKNGKAYPVRSGFCLETQFYPDAPNHPHFPQPTVTKSAPQKFTTAFKFSVKD